MKNKNLSLNLTGRSKIFLLISLCCAAAVDFTAFIYMVVTVGGSTLWLFPLLFALLDALFIFQALFSNFRFKYTVFGIAFYILATAVVLVIMAYECFTFPEFFTNSASLIWINLHVLTLVSSLFCYLYSAKRFKAKAALQAVISAIFTGLCLVGTCFYIFFVIGAGVFGQGGVVTRPLVYAFDESTQTYSVVGVLDGSGDNVYVPEKFNDFPVRNVSASIFSAEGIKCVTLDCSPDVGFTDVGLEAVSSELKVCVPKQNIDKFKDVFYNLDSRSAFILGNSVIPFGLDENEVFVTFSYDSTLFDNLSGKILPTWFGKSGEVFDTNCFSDIDYAQHTDKNSDSDLIWNYNNNDKTIMSSILDEDENNIIGRQITGDITGATVIFEQIYRVFPGESNDAEYAAVNDFVYSQDLNYKLTTLGNANKITDNYVREGFEDAFELSWQYSVYSITSNRTDFADLKSVLSQYGYLDVYIHPVWKLKAPEFSISSNIPTNTVTYGENISFNSSTKLLNGLTYSYFWSENGQQISQEKNLDVENISFGNKIYALKVVVEGAETVGASQKSTTSLSAESIQEIEVTVDKRPVTVEWQDPEDNVYSGTDKRVQCAISSGIINSDDVSLNNSQFNYRHVGSYSESVHLSGADAQKYAILRGQSHSYSIVKANLTVNWTTSETVYNGEEQTSAVTFTGVQGEDEIEYETTSAINAGTYTLSLSLKHSDDIKNYNLLNETHSFTIERKPVSVKWNADCDDEFIYDGKSHTVVATADGVNGNTLVLLVSRSTIRDVGEYKITASAELHPNYEINGSDSKTYKINKYGLTVEWGNTELTYTGRSQFPSYVMRGVGDDGNILGGGRGGEKNVGEGYVCTVDRITEQYNNDKNYFIEKNASTVYSIVPASVAVRWDVPEMMYDGTEQKPSAWIVGLGDDAAVSMSCNVTGAIKAGTHKSVATYEGELSENYILTDAERYFTISKKIISVIARDITIKSGEEVPELKYDVSQLAIGDEVKNILSVTVTVKFGSDEIKPGVYDIEISVRLTAQGEENYTVITTDGKLTVEAPETEEIPEENENGV